MLSKGPVPPPNPTQQQQGWPKLPSAVPEIILQSEMLARNDRYGSALVGAIRYLARPSLHPGWDEGPLFFFDGAVVRRYLNDWPKLSSPLVHYTPKLNTSRLIPSHHATPDLQPETLSPGHPDQIYYCALGIITKPLQLPSKGPNSGRSDCKKRAGIGASGCATDCAQFPLLPPSSNR